MIDVAPRLLGVCLLTIAACGGSSKLDSVRFINQDPVTVVNDRLDTPTVPEANPFVKMSYHSDSYLVVPLRRLTRMRPPLRAQNTNALGEVPDSTWFTNRIGVRELSAKEAGLGTNRENGPMQNKPWTVESSKVGGASIGFIIKDSAGDKYILKFDAKELPEAETAADVISAKILWAIGYNVADDYVVDFSRDELIIAPDAEMKFLYKESTPLTEAKLTQSLESVYARPDGRIRGLLSRFVPGMPMDGWPREGTREGDPNDLVPHEMRRELRGAYPIFSWISHSDIKEDNTLDVYAEDPENSQIHYLRHFFIDIGNTLGVQGATHLSLRYGFEFIMEPKSLFRQLFSLGLYKRRWETRDLPGIQGIGVWSSDEYDPGTWTSNFPNYLPILMKDKWDAFWGAKLLIRLNEEHLRAIIKTGQYSDPRADDFMLRVLIERQRKTARYWFERVNPIDEFELLGTEAGGMTLCFDDLLLKYELGNQTTVYQAASYSYEGKRLSEIPIERGAQGRSCASRFALSSGSEGYTIVTLHTERPGQDLGMILVHIAKSEDDTPRIIGIRRL